MALTLKMTIVVAICAGAAFAAGSIIALLAI